MQKTPKSSAPENPPGDVKPGLDCEGCLYCYPGQSGEFHCRVSANQQIDTTYANDCGSYEPKRALKGLFGLSGA